ncbi:MAG TPA: FAD-dependent oxidoreductase, partial [Planctomycetes bacterium]|nr:FAD-dependent oxidoreductase [Planctomycetota bacterium]
MDPYDLAVVGGGVVGCAVAREASKYDLSCALLEAKADVGAGTSKANTAIWHTGFDAKTGTLEQRLLARSYKLLLDYVPDRGIPHEKTGAVLIAWNEDQLASLEGIVERAHANGVADVRLLSVEEVYELEPHVNRDALGGVMVPGESIICPFTVPLSYAYEAVMNGADLYREFPVGKIEEQGGVYVLSGPGGEVKARFVVNA